MKKRGAKEKVQLFPEDLFQAATRSSDSDGGSYSDDVVSLPAAILTRRSPRLAAVAGAV